MPEAKAIPGLPTALAIICFATGCSPKPSKSPELPRPVKTMVVTVADEPNTLSFPGRVEASKRVDLAFQVPGVLLKLPRKEGDAVPKGEVIAQLRQDEFQARLKTVQGDLDRAKATLDALRLGERPEEQLRREAQLRSADAKLANAKAEFDRYARLVQSSAVSRSEYDLAETAYHIAQEEYKAAQQVFDAGTSARKEDVAAQEAAVRGLEGRVAEMNLQLRDSTLRAPYDGIIAQRLVDEGQNIMAITPVVKFQHDGEVDIVVDVPETFMANELRPGTILQIYAEFGSTPGRKFPVKIKEATQVADAKTQTFQVRVAMKAPSGATPLPGMTATVTVAYPQATSGNHILVPISAVTKTDAGEQVVWIIAPDQTVSSRPVKMGDASGSQIEIVEGLHPGDRIVVAGVSFLRNGMKVRDLGDALGGSSL